jgi:hypothetical protein
MLQALKMHSLSCCCCQSPSGVEQKATRLQIRQQPPTTSSSGLGVMNSTAIKEAVATSYRTREMYGVWYPGRARCGPGRRRRQGL